MNIHSPLRAWLAGIPWSKYIDHIQVDTSGPNGPVLYSGTFSGHIPPDVAKEIVRRSDESPLPPWSDLLLPMTKTSDPGTNQRGDFKQISPGVFDHTNLQTVYNPPPTTPEEELADWWRNTAENEIDQTVDKAVEYGSTDLIDIGRDLARITGREVDDQQAAEWGIYFYLLGKMSRWRSAMERGDRVSDDTLLDIGVYSRMAQRVRAAGGWPGTGGKIE